ncbi:MAG: hypothetical protein JW841_10435 [Deltaproteobacteria bacterium]|nr:hypothetical protein [Deltaproteobacteria bacterium]
MATDFEKTINQTAGTAGTTGQVANGNYQYLQSDTSGVTKAKVKDSKKPKALFIADQFDSTTLITSSTLTTPNNSPKISANSAVDKANAGFNLQKIAKTSGADEVEFNAEQKIIAEQIDAKELELIEIGSQLNNTDKVYNYLPAKLEAGQCIKEVSSNGDYAIIYQIDAVNDDGTLIIDQKYRGGSLPLPKNQIDLAEQIAAHQPHWVLVNDDGTTVSTPIYELTAKQWQLNQEIAELNKDLARTDPKKAISYWLKERLERYQQEDLPNAASAYQAWMTLHNDGDFDGMRVIRTVKRAVLNGEINKAVIKQNLFNAYNDLKPGRWPLAVTRVHLLDNIQKSYLAALRNIKQDKPSISEDIYLGIDIGLDWCANAYPDFPKIEQSVPIAMRHFKQAIRSKDIFAIRAAQNWLMGAFMVMPNNSGECVGVVNGKPSLTAAITWCIQNNKFKSDNEILYDYDSLEAIVPLLEKDDNKNWNILLSYFPWLATVDAAPITYQSEIGAKTILPIKNCVYNECKRLQKIQQANPYIVANIAEVANLQGSIRSIVKALKLEAIDDELSAEFSKTLVSGDFYASLLLGVGVGSLTSLATTQIISQANRICKTGNATQKAIRNARMLQLAMEPLNRSVQQGVMCIYNAATGNEQGLQQSRTPMAFLNNILGGYTGMFFNRMQSRVTGRLLTQSLVRTCAEKTALLLGETTLDMTMSLLLYYKQNKNFDGAAQFMRANLVGMISGRIANGVMSKTKIDVTFNKKNIIIGHKDLTELEILEHQANQKLDEYYTLRKKNVSNEEKNKVLDEAIALFQKAVKANSDINEDLYTKKIVDKREVLIKSKEFLLERPEYEHRVKKLIEEAKSCGDQAGVAKYTEALSTDGVIDRHGIRLLCTTDGDYNENTRRRLAAYTYCDYLGSETLNKIIAANRNNTKRATGKTKQKQSGSMPVVESHMLNFDDIKDIYIVVHPETKKYSDADLLREMIADYNSNPFVKDDYLSNSIDILLTTKDPAMGYTLANEYNLDLRNFYGNKVKQKTRVNPNDQEKQPKTQPAHEAVVLYQIKDLLTKIDLVENDALDDLCNYYLIAQNRQRGTSKAKTTSETTHTTSANENSSTSKVITSVEKLLSAVTYQKNVLGRHLTKKELQDLVEHGHKNPPKLLKSLIKKYCDETAYKHFEDICGRLQKCRTTYYTTAKEKLKFPANFDLVSFEYAISRYANTKKNNASGQSLMTSADIDAAISHWYYTNYHILEKTTPKYSTSTTDINVTSSTTAKYTVASLNHKVKTLTRTNSWHERTLGDLIENNTITHETYERISDAIGSRKQDSREISFYQPEKKDNEIKLVLPDNINSGDDYNQLIALYYSEHNSYIHKQPVEAKNLINMLKDPQYAQRLKAFCNRKHK